ncbi:uncharacterized protein LOC131875953 [Cryptomeria japonica]|uniref:uncharacterized protein LOC131875953 n=1 Tax=Cryptomeria japonica TaxID=3369 RepID=UPI0027DA1DD8|nr:uncharacterized protein LOC131875953 [Cryptomeria japonica]
MAHGTYKQFPGREECSTSTYMPYNDVHENPFCNENRKDKNPQYEEHLTEKEKKNKQWDAIILQMADLGGDEAEMARAMKRQPDEILKRLGVKREHLYCTDTSSSEPTVVGGNNRGYNANYGGNYNNGNGNGNNNWNNGNNNNSNNSNGNGYNGNNNYNGGGNNGNHGNNGGNHNGRNINNQNNNSRHRPPMTIERYRQLDFTGIVGHPNHISNDLRNAIPKFIGNGTDTTEQHVMNVKNTIEEFKIPHEDVFMKFFVQSLTQDAGEWYQSLPDRSISSWQEFVTLFLEEFGDHNDPSFYFHELTSIKKNQNESVFEFNKSKTHYEILSHKPATLQQAYKAASTIENNRKAVGRVGKREDPNLYNPRAPKRDDFGQIMDMLKGLKDKQNQNEKSQSYRNNRPTNFNRPRLHDMPYNTSWKDGKLVKPSINKETPDPLKMANNLVEDFPWCNVCNLSHSEEKCMIALSSNENQPEEDEYQPTINVLSSEPMWGKDEDSSEGEYYSDMHKMRYNQQYSVQQVFTDDEDDSVALRKLFQSKETNTLLRNLSEEEKRAFIVAAIAQAKSNY